MLVKLAFVMQRLKNYLKKNFCHDQQRWGDTAVMRGHRVHGRIRPVPPPPLGKILDSWGLCTTTRFGVCAKATNGQNDDSVHGNMTKVKN